MCIDGEVLDLDDMKQGLKEHEATVRKFFNEKVLLGLNIEEEELKIIIQKMGDNLRAREHGFGITDKRCNPLLAGMRNRLVFHILKITRLRSKFVRDVDVKTHKVFWKRDALQEWMDDAGRFLQMFVPLIHITSGQPARGEELATLAVRNSESQSRGVYWAYSTIMMVTRYHKSRSGMGVDRPVPRFLPYQLVPLFLLYIAVAKPTEVLFANELYQSSPSASKAHWKFLFCANGKRWTGSDICNAFRKQMYYVTGFEFKFSAYRHACVAFMKNLIKYKLPDGFGEVGTIDQEGEGRRGEINGMTVLDEQACHSSDVGEKLYAISDEDLSDLTKGQGLSYRVASGLWSALIGYPQEKLAKWLEKSKGPFKIMSPVPKGDCLCETQNELLTKDRCKSPKHCEIELPGVKRPWSDSLQTQCQNSSLLKISRRRICFGSGGWCEESSLSLAEVSTSQITVSQAAMMTVHLRKFLRNNNASFKSPQQMLATVMVRDRAEDVLVVMPTGSEKTITYFLPAWMEQTSVTDGAVKLVTVVIVPLVSLMEDLKRRCVSHSLEVGFWRERSLNPTILLVPVEIVGTTSFRQHCNSLAATGSLSRIVIEEAHTRLTWEEFRPKMRSINQARPEIPVPIILLTGTAPPSHVFELSVSFSSPFKIVRMPTSRLNLRYRVERLDDKESENIPQAGSSIRLHQREGVMLVRERIVCIIGEFINKMGSDSKERAIVFCPSKKECHEIQELLNAQSRPFSNPKSAVYHSDMSEQERAENHRRWIQGQVLVMISTCAFGTGIDYPSVRLVVHSGLSYSMLDFAQETGRAGRDGVVSDCVLVTHKDCFSQLTEEFYNGVRDLGKFGRCGRGPFEEAKRFMKFFAGFNTTDQEFSCRRQKLQEFLDGTAENCFAQGPTCVMCDICEASLKSVQNDDPRAGSVNAASSATAKTHHAPLLESASVVESSPSQLIRIAANASNMVRKDATHLFSMAVDIGQRMRFLCSYCVVNAKEGGNHSESECPHMKGRCFRCLQKGHVSSICPVTATGLFQSPRRHCFKCYVDHPEAHTSRFGSQCQTGFESFRNIAIGLWFAQKPWLQTSFADLRIMTGDRSIMSYGKWLYSVFRGNHVPRILVVVIAWFQHRRELASQHSTLKNLSQ